jgi:hypothetical protein
LNRRKQKEKMGRCVHSSVVQTHFLCPAPSVVLDPSPTLTASRSHATERGGARGWVQLHGLTGAHVHDKCMLK